MLSVSPPECTPNRNTGKLRRNDTLPAPRNIEQQYPVQRVDVELAVAAVNMPSFSLGAMPWDDDDDEATEEQSDMLAPGCPRSQIELLPVEVLRKVASRLPIHSMFCFALITPAWAAVIISPLFGCWQKCLITMGSAAGEF